jgi:hypothetical protein
VGTAFSPTRLPRKIRSAFALGFFDDVQNSGWRTSRAG